MKMCLNCALWLEAIDTMKSSSKWYVQVILGQRLPIRSMDLFKILYSATTISRATETKLTIQITGK